MNQFDRRTRQLLDAPVVPTLLKMAIPNALVMFAQLAIALVEIYFLARLGVDVLAGVSLVFPVLSWIGAVSQGAVGGGVVTASRARSAAATASSPASCVVRLSIGHGVGLADDDRNLWIVPFLRGDGRAGALIVGKPSLLPSDL